MLTKKGYVWAMLKHCLRKTKHKPLDCSAGIVLWFRYCNDQSTGVNLMTRQQRIHLAQRARSMAYNAWWQAVCEQVEFSLYDARKAPRK